MYVTFPNLADKALIGLLAETDISWDNTRPIVITDLDGDSDVWNQAKLHQAINIVFTMC